MKKVDFLIIGGSAAGTTAAEIIRSLHPISKISIVTDEDHEQYSRVLIPHYIRGKVQRDQVFLKKEQWYREKKIELIKKVSVRRLEVSSKSVELSTGERIQYNKLLVATGGKVILLDVPGVKTANICYMRTVEDADRIIAEAKKAKKALIIGGGFIGLEFASCFKVNGVEEVTFLVKEPYFWSGKLDEDSAGAIADVLTKNGVKIVTNCEVDHFDGKDVVTKDGNKYAADVVGVGIGIKSDFSWLQSSGITINRAIVTDEYLSTNVPDIYAAGDCAEFKDVIFERQHVVGNWSNATSQGSAVGKNMGGQRTVFETASSYTISFFDPPRLASGEAGSPNNGSITFIGVTEDKYAEQVIVRGSRTEGKVTRIFVKSFSGSDPKNSGRVGPSKRIVGATVINNPIDVAPLTMAIKNKIDIAAYLGDLGEADFDLKQLLSS